MSPFAVLRTYIGRDRQKGASLFLYTYFIYAFSRPEGLAGNAKEPRISVALFHGLQRPQGEYPCSIISSREDVTSFLFLSDI